MFISGSQALSQWGKSGWDAFGKQDPMAQLSPSALSFNQGPLSTGPLIDTSQKVAVPNVSMGNVAPNMSKLTGWDKANIAIGGLQTIGSLFMAHQANKLAKKQFRFQKDFANANLTNSIKSYNTALEDRIRARSFTEGREPGYADNYIAQNRMEDRRVG